MISAETIRTLFELRYSRGLSVTECAARVGMSKPHASKLLSGNIRQRLTRQLLVEFNQVDNAELLSIINKLRRENALLKNRLKNASNSQRVRNGNGKVFVALRGMVPGVRTASALAAERKPTTPNHQQQG